MWNPFGVALEINATALAVTRISATKFTVEIYATWQTYYEGAETNYGMKVTSGGKTIYIPAFNGSAYDHGRGELIGTYDISGNGAQTKTISVVFENYKTSPASSKTTTLSLNVSVPALPSYTVTYNSNGGTGAPSSQTKWKDQTLTLSSTKPTRTGYSFQGWATSASGSVVYAAGASYTANGSVTLYAVWKANEYTVAYNANGGTGAPSSQTKKHGTALTLSSTKPTRQYYTFLGWATSASATTAQYAAGASYTANTAVTLYAVWESAYVPPTVYNFTLTRCDQRGEPMDEGDSILVEFGWKTTYSNPRANIVITPGDARDEIDFSGTSGRYSGIHTVQGGCDAEQTYVVKVLLEDVTTTIATATAPGGKYPFDAKAGNDGVSFGKSAELGADDSLGGRGVAEFSYDAKFNEPVYGKVLGMDKLPAIPSGGDFNNYMDTGCYAVKSNAIAESCLNIPVARAGRLEVWSATGEGVRLEQWSYLRQRFIPYNSGNAVWERELTRGEDNVWHYYDWWKSSLTPAASEKVYSKAAMTIALSANTVLGAVNTYTKIPFDRVALSTNGRLTLENNAIRIGSNIQYVKVSAQTLISPGNTDGLRHIRIQKVSGGTTSSVAWNTLNITASRHTLHTLTPMLVSVKEGDLLQMVFYTANANDSISSGTTANGWQTYFTVEEL